MKILKYTFFIVLLITLILVGLIIAIPLLINPNDYKDKIEQGAQQVLQRQLHIDGDIDVSFSFPLSVAFKLGTTRLDNPADFNLANNNRHNHQNVQIKPFFRIKNIELQASLWPLVKENRLQIGKIVLNKAQISLHKNRNGQVNWNFGSKHGGKENARSQTSSSQKRTVNKTNQSDTKLPQIQIQGLELQDAQFVFTDDSQHQHISLDHINLTISEITQNKPIDIKLATRFSLRSQGIDGQLQMQTTAIVDIARQQYQLNALQIALDSRGKVIPGGQNRIRFGANIFADLGKQQLRVSNLSLQSNPVQITGNIDASSLLSAPQYQMVLAIKPFSVTQLMRQLKITMPSFQNTDALSRLQLDMKLGGDQNNLSISQFVLKIDQTTIKGNAGIENFRQPAYRFDVDVDQLNLDDYTLKTAQAKKPGQSATGNKTQSDTQRKQSDQSPTEVDIIPVALLRQLNVQGQIRLHQFHAAQIKMDNIVLTVNSKQGKLSLDPVNSDFYQGKLMLKTDIDVRGKTPLITIQQDFKNINLGQLLQDSIHSKDFTGTANIFSHITTRGNKQSQLVKNANGKGHFLITDGSIAKLDILHTIRKTYAIIKGLPIPTESQKKNTEFTELKGSVQIKNGIVHNNDLYAKTPVMVIKGKGYADLPQQYLNYTLLVRLLGSLKIDQNTNSTDFRNYDIPYTIKGKFQELSQKANIEGFLKQQLKTEAKRQINKQVDKYLHSDKGKQLEQKLGGKTIQKFKGLLGF